MRSLALSCALLLGACSTPCQELAKKICACEPTTSARSACERRAGQVQSTNEIDEKQQAICEDHLEDCDCYALDSTPGKVACGLAACSADTDCAAGKCNAGACE